jgi:Transposase C of IS166 homeodomain
VQQRALPEQHAALKRQVEGLQRQLFGRKSEQRLRAPDPDQRPLTGRLTAPGSPAEQPPPPTATVTASQRRVRFTGADLADESALRCDESVPVPAIVLTQPAVAALPPDASAVMGEKVT